MMACTIIVPITVNPEKAYCGILTQIHPQLTKYSVPVKHISWKVRMDLGQDPTLGCFHG